jgi:hypothetical protein
MKTMDGQTLKIGDTILTSYHDIPVVGVINGYDGSGCIYLSFPGALPQPVVYGIPRDGICLHYYDVPHTVAHLVSRPTELPELFELPATCVGGCHARKPQGPSLTEVETAGKAAVARRDQKGAAALRTVYRALRSAQA